MQMLGHSGRCLTKGNIISVTHYLPVQAHRLGHLFLCWGKHKRPLSRAVIYECCIRRTWSYPYLAGVAVDIYFLLGLALCYVGCFISHLLAELEQVICGGLAVPQRRGKAWEVHLRVVLCWVRNLSGVSECQLLWTRVGHSHSAAFWCLERGCCHGQYMVT